jgi:hypothetical protein
VEPAKLPKRNDGLPNNVIELSMKTNSFDEAAYGKLIDRVLDDTLTIPDAIDEAAKLLA